MVTVSLENFYYHSLALLTNIFILFIFSDRFRTAINVFGDSIGCAIVQHLSRKELAALDNKGTSLDEDNPNTVLPLLASNKTTTHSSNQVVPTTYDNPTFVNHPGTIPEDKDDTEDRTTF